MGKNKLVKAATLIMVLTLVSKIIGFLRDALIASTFGATYRTDAYNIAISIPDIIFAIFSLAITTTFIPLLSETFKNEGKKEMFRFANNIMKLLTIVLLVLSVLGWFLSPQIVRILAPKFTGKAFDLTVQLTEISVFNIIFMGITGGYNSILQTLDSFIAPALIGIVMNVPIILYILFGATGGVVGLIIATLIGNVLKVVVQVPSLVKEGYRPILKINIRDKRINRMLFLILPVIIGAGCNQINAIVDKNVASGLAYGSISALSFSSRITDVVYATFATAIVTVIYPTLSKEAVAGNMDTFKRYITKGVNNISIIMFPWTLLMIILSTPIVVILFKHGIFDSKAVSITSTALLFYSVGLPFYGIRDIFNRSLYALNDTKTSTINGIIAVLSNIGFNLILPRFMGIGGVALSTSIAAIVATLLLARSLGKKIGGFEWKSMMKQNVKIIIASILMSITTYFIYIGINSHFGGNFIEMFMSLCAAGLCGMLVYAFILKLFRIQEFEEILGQLTFKLRGKRV